MENTRMKLPLFDDSWIDFRTNTKRRWFAPEVYSVAPSGAFSFVKYPREAKLLTAVGSLKLFSQHIKSKSWQHFAKIIGAVSLVVRQFPRT